MFRCVTKIAHEKFPKYSIDAHSHPHLDSDLKTFGAFLPKKNTYKNMLKTTTNRVVHFNLVFHCSAHPPFSYFLANNRDKAPSIQWNCRTISLTKNVYFVVRMRKCATINIRFSWTKNWFSTEILFRTWIIALSKCILRVII